MRLTINEKEVTIPSSLSEITLQQRIDFQRLHGNELDEILKSIYEIEEGIERDIEYSEYIKKKRSPIFLFTAELSQAS